MAGRKATIGALEELLEGLAVGGHRGDGEKSRGQVMDRSWTRRGHQREGGRGGGGCVEDLVDRQKRTLRLSFNDPGTDLRPESQDGSGRFGKPPPWTHSEKVPMIFNDPVVFARFR